MSGIWGAKGFTSKTRPSAFVKSVLKNGVGRYVQQLQRITIRLCQKSPESRVVRDFVDEELAGFAQKNPSVVVYVVGEEYDEPKVCAEYLNGRSEVHPLLDLTKEEIADKLEVFKNRSGLEIVRIRKSHHTDFPSVQGQWTPFTNMKNYSVKYKPESKIVLRDAWEPLGQPWQGLYRRHELYKLTEREKLSYEDKKSRPLGKWGPQLKPEF